MGLYGISHRRAGFAYSTIIKFYNHPTRWIKSVRYIYSLAKIAIMFDTKC